MVGRVVVVLSRVILLLYSACPLTAVTWFLKTHNSALGYYCYHDLWHAYFCTFIYKSAKKNSSVIRLRHFSSWIEIGLSMFINHKDAKETRLRAVRVSMELMT